MERGIEPVRGGKLIVAPTLDNRAIFYNEYDIGGADGREPMSNHYGRGARTLDAARRANL